MKPFFLTKLEALQIAAPILFVGILAGFALGYWIARRRSQNRRRILRPMLAQILNN